jgi:hypothetical protein
MAGLASLLGGGIGSMAGPVGSAVGAGLAGAAAGALAGIPKIIVSDAEKANKAEQLNSLYKAIRHLQIKGNIVPLINQAKILNKQVSMLMDRYKSDFEGKENDGIPQDKINAFAHQETNTAEINNLIHLESCINLGIDHLNRPDHEWAFRPIDCYPEGLRNEMKKFPHLIKTSLI